MPLKTWLIKLKTTFDLLVSDMDNQKGYYS